jgi:hypothetical protein
MQMCTVSIVGFALGAVAIILIVGLIISYYVSYRSFAYYNSYACIYVIV